MSLSLEQLRENVAEEVVLSHVLPALPVGSYSRLSKAYSQQSAIDLVKSVSLDFDTSLVVEYEDSIPANTAAGVMLYFTLDFIGIHNDGYSFARYSNGLFTMVIESDEDGDIAIISVIMKLLHTSLNTWEEVEVDDLVDMRIVNMFEASLSEATSIAEELISRIGCDFRLGTVLETSYDVQTSVAILVRLGLDRSGGNEQLIPILEATSGSRVLSSLIQGESFTLDLERCNLSEYVLGLELSWRPTDALEQLRQHV